MLPPYLKWIPPEEDGTTSVTFLEFPVFHRHKEIPLVMCRDLYENGATTGTLHHVDFLSLYAVRSGKGVHLIDDHPYGVVRGDVYLMASGASHSFSQYNNLEIDVFHFQNTIFNEEELAALRQSPGIWQLYAGDLGVDHRIHASPDEWRAIEAQIEVLREEWGEAAPAGPILLKHEFFRLLILLARLLQKRKENHTGGSEKRAQDSGLAAALRYCEEHFDKPLSVPDLAARSFFSRSHFTELFSREVGMSPAAYVRRIRLEKARALLRETKQPVAQIAAQCGFKDVAQFSRAFRDFYEKSPMQYRKKD